MAAIKGKNYTKNTAVPKEQSNAGEAGGVSRVLFDQFDGTPIAADVLTIGKLPKGARVLAATSLGLGGAGLAWAKVDANGVSTTLAAGDLLASESLIKVTIGAAPSANPSGFINYAVE